MELLRLFSRLIAFVGLTTLIACSDANLETERLSSLEPILFSGQETGVVITDKVSSAMMTASCDKTTTDIKISTTPAGSFSSLSQSSALDLSSLIDNCRKMGQLKIDVLQLSLLNFTQWQKEAKSLYFKAISGPSESKVTELVVDYIPPSKPKTPVGLSYALASGEVTDGGNFKLKFKIGKPIPSVINGGSFQVRMIGSQ